MATLRGRVERRRIQVGSKSEHEALVLVDDDGSAWKLRRLGGHPFNDPTLATLEGRRVELSGYADASTFFLDGWRDVP
jgi:hypothetical protein